MVMIAEESPQLAPGLSGVRILVVEPEPIIAMDLAQILASHGANVIGPMIQPNEALALLDIPPVIHVAVLDVSATRQSSWSVAKALRERAIPFVFTASSALELPPGYDGVPCLPKPVWEGKLVKLLGTLVGVPYSEAMQRPDGLAYQAEPN